MIRISQIKLHPSHTEQDLKQAVCKACRISLSDLHNIRIVKKSLDARDKEDIKYVYTADAETDNEDIVLKRCRNNKNISPAEPHSYTPPERGSEWMDKRPCVIGAGPCGLFCAYLLARYGYKPILIEQGEDAESRLNSVIAFWEGRAPLDPYSNIQFGEGGAGTFSDGKLTTGVKDTDGRKTLVLEILSRHGAPEEIMYTAKPHIGTDVLIKVVKSMREDIIANGGSVWFNTRFLDYNTKDGRIDSILISRKGNLMNLTCSDLVLAIGHSSRDTFKMLFEKGLEMQPKPFAVGIRAEHLQSDINLAQYGHRYKELYGDLPPADYKLTAHTKDGHSVYSFCMCPGGFVVNSSSEEGHLCVNGMSYSDRGGINANSAIVVNVSPEDIGAVNDPLAAIRFQREIEEKAYQSTGGSIPVQRLEDFKNGKVSNGFGKVTPQMKGSCAFADINDILPRFIAEDIKEAFEQFASQIKGYDDPDTCISAVESRTSSPVRIIRNSSFETSVKGIYPCGEGAGYAGGITSAAIDGIKVFEEICRRYRV